jgi:RecA-family ATPase
MSEPIDPLELINLMDSDPRRFQNILDENPEIADEIESAEHYGQEEGPYGTAFLDREEDITRERRRRENEEQEAREQEYWQRIEKERREQEEEERREDEEEERREEEERSRLVARARKAWPVADTGPRFLEERELEPDWLLKSVDPNEEGRQAGFLRMGRVGCIAAPGGTGKTMGAISLAMSVACGAPWLHPAAWSGEGCENTPSPPRIHVVKTGRVALLLAEEDVDDIRRRAYQASKMMALSAEQREQVRSRLRILGLNSHEVALVDEEGGRTERLAQLETVLQEEAGEGFSLIILDPLTRFAGLGAETDNARATRFVQAVETLTKLPGNPAVLFLHHERKGGSAGGSGQDAIRGSSAIVDGARWALRLVPVWEPSRSRGAEYRPRWTTKGGDRALWLHVVKSNYTGPMSSRILLIQDRHYQGALRYASDWEREQLEDAIQAAKTKKQQEAEARAKAKAATSAEPKVTANEALPWLEKSQ